MSWRRVLTEPSWSRLDVYGFTAYVIFAGSFLHSDAAQRMGFWARNGICLGALAVMVLVVAVLTWLLGGWDER